LSTKSTLQAENSTFFWRGRGQKTPLRLLQNTPLKVQNSHFLGRGLDLSPGPDCLDGRGTLLLTTQWLHPLHPNQAFWIRPASPQNSSQRFG